jgi:hypothetical protein
MNNLSDEDMRAIINVRNQNLIEMIEEQIQQNVQQS